MKNNNGDDFEKKWFSHFRNFAEQNEDDAGIAGWSKTGLEARLRYFIRYSKINIPGELGTWADIGCGAGTYSNLLSKYHHKVIGIDYSKPSLIKARARYGASILWVVGNAKSLPVRNECINAALCFGVSQALSDVKPVVTDVRRILVPNGVIWIDGLNKWCLPNLWQRIYRKTRGIPQHLRYDSPRKFKQLMKRSGYTNIEVYCLPLFPKKLQWLQRFIEISVINRMINLLQPITLLISHSFIIKATSK